MKSNLIILKRKLSKIILTLFFFLSFNCNTYAQIEMKPKFFPYTIELTSIDPGNYDKVKNIWVQPFPMPAGRSEVKFKYTLKNKINTKAGIIKADISGTPLLSSAAFSNKIIEVEAGTNFSGQFYCYALPPGNYNLNISYTGKGTRRYFTKGGIWQYLDTTFAAVLFEYVVRADVVDNDKDGIEDTQEQMLLEKFRPYYKFSKQYGKADDYRPTDVSAFIKNSELLDTDNEDASPIRGNNILANRQSAVVFGKQSGDGTTPFGSSDILSNPTSTQYHINPLNNGSARNGAGWNTVTLYKNIGLYGHVVPVKLEVIDGIVKYDRLKIPNSNDAGDNFIKIEYWQYYAFNECHCGDAGVHEGDWTTVQLIYNPRNAAIETVFFYEHGQLEIRFDMFGSKGPFTVSYPEVAERFVEYQGNNYDVPCYADGGLINTNWISKTCSNNAIRFCEDPDTRQFTHPVVYIENGGHEPWPMWHGYFAGAANHNGDDYEHSFLTATPPNLGEVEFPFLTTAGAFEILRFNGNWGAKNGGARGPSLHKQWTWPASSSIRWLISSDKLVD